MNGPAHVSLMCLLLMLVSALRADAGTGWRTDGTGRYPGATPPLAWAKETNVVWKTKLPSPSNGSPVISGDRLFVCAEPSTLICLSLADGKILWEKPNGYQELLPAETFEKLQKARAVQKEVRNLQNKLNKSPSELGLYAKLADLCRTIADDPKNAESFPLVVEYKEPPKHNVAGYSTPTPVTDGRNVYVLTGLGTVACYDREGNRKWIRLLEKPKQGHGHSASPLLVGGKLIVHVINLFALDVNTGETLWQHDARPNWGSPAHVRVGDTDAVVTAGGDVVQVSDGKGLAKKLGALEYATPIVHESVVYFIQHGGKAVKLPETVGEKFEKQDQWKTKPRKDRYYGSAVYHDGIIYAATQKGAFSAIDATTGEVIYEQDLKLGGIVYPSVAFAGRHVYVSSDKGATAVIKPGRKYEEIARNQLETFRSCPVFADKRMYVRGSSHVWCIGE